MNSTSTNMMTMIGNSSYDSTTKMTDIEQYYTILKNQTTNQLGLYLFCCSISIIWTVYIMFFNSRITGIIATFLLNHLYLKRYYKNVWLKIGSLSISILSGKVMFRSVHYTSLDYMFYIQDGYLQFAFWRPQFVKEELLIGAGKEKEAVAAAAAAATDSSSNADSSTKPTVPTATTAIPLIVKKKVARLEIMLNNLQIHYYNSWKQYDVVSNLSNLNTNNAQSTITSTSASSTSNNDGALFKEHLMYLFSIVNLRIQKGRVYFGNNSTLNSILAIKFSNSKMELVTETSQSKVDDFCYVLSGDITKLEVSFLVVKSNSTNQFKLFSNNGETKKPKSENRILILRSQACDFKYIQDIPTILTFDRRRVLKTISGEFVHDNKEPQWSLVVNCLKHGTQQTNNFVLNYGPWYDRQREELWKYFFPQTYETLEPQASPKLNERRQISKFDFVLNIKEGVNAEINLIFCSNKSDIQDKKLTFRCRGDSTLSCSIPWLTKKHGYQTNICATFDSVQSYTNMSFKHFLCAEQIKLNLDIHYPLIWNDLQKWDVNLDFYRTTVILLFHHKYFIQDLINDWSSRTIADLRTFVPYVYNINVNVADLELLLPSNQHNWIDTNFIENNAYLALLAPTAVIKTSFIFEDFYPEKSKVKLDIKANEVCARFIIPETNTHLILLKLLRKNLKFISSDGVKTTFNSNRWSKFNSTSEYYLNDYDKKSYSQHLNENWFEFGQSDKVELTLAYTYHPCPLINWSDGDSVDEKGVKTFDVENCFTPTAAYLKQMQPESKEFDCEVFKPDVISVQVEIGPCTLLVYGTFLKRLWYVKEAYFSWDQLYSEIKNEFQQKLFEDISSLAACDKNDGRNFRPLSIDLTLAIHNIHGHLVLDSSGDPFPIGFTDRLCVELDKSYKETRLQLYVDPINLFLFDSVKRKYDKNLKQGHLCLSSLQVRGHAMFSDVGRVKTDTLEYAWLLEILLGDVSGYLTPVQSEQVIHFLETFLNLILENEYDLKPVYLNRVDPGLPYKYCVTKFSLDSVDIYLAESGTALNIQLYPIRVSMCNSHTDEYAKGLSAYIHEIKLKQYLNEANRNFNNNLNDTLTNDTTTRSESQVSHKADLASKSASETVHRRDSDISTVTISSLSSSCSSLFSLLNNNKKDANGTTATAGGQTITNSQHQQHIPDSNEFNYWFECSSFQTGPIMLDMQLEKGDAVEQIKFLRLHDEDTKRLYFLWDSYFDFDLREHVTKTKIGHKCGCIGGCYFYSVGNNENYFKSTKALTKTGNYAKSLFNSKFNVLNSHKVMQGKYEVKYYKYQLLDEKNSEVEHQPVQKAVPTIQISNSVHKLSQKPVSVASKSVESLRMNRVSSNLTNSNNNDDYYTADEDDGDDKSLHSARRQSFKFIKTNSVASMQSFVSVNETTLNADDDSDEEITVLERPADLKLNVNLNKTPFVNKTIDDDDEDEDAEDEDEDASVIINHDEDIDLNMAAQNSKLTLKFDIQKPILESVLPKYCYLKHLSRANVKNWNLISKFPYFNEFKQNFAFTPIQTGFNCNLLKKNPLVSNNNSTATRQTGEKPTPVIQTPNDDVKCRVNLCFTNAIECYVTPLILTCLERYVKALKAYKLNPHTLLTEVDAKSQANCASDSLIEVISRTQISLNIPEIRLCSLQVGLAEDKTNMLIDTLVHPDELVTLSLFTICIHNIETQLSDSRNLKAAIFKINKIDTQFRRLHTDGNSKQPIKLSCITNERSKVSFQCFNPANDILVSTSPGSIMYECAFEEISIKAIKKFQELSTTKNGDDNISTRSVISEISSSTLTSAETLHSNRTLINNNDSDDEAAAAAGQYQSSEGVDGGAHNNNNSRISLCEFDISKIWFSFPEPPISPKGKRKIPYNRYEWNLLSSVSPAVISWLCATKHVTKPFKQYLNKHNKHLLQTLAALLTGSLKHNNELRDALNNAKLASQYQKNNFLNYLTQSSQLYNKDINCRLVKILRLYLLNYSGDLQSDLACKQIPDMKSLKRGINEVLNCWSNILLGPSSSDYNNAANEKYRYITEIRQIEQQQSRLQQQQQQQVLTDRRLSSTLTTQNVNFINQSVSFSKVQPPRSYHLLSPFSATLNSSNQSSGDESTFDIGASSILHPTSQQIKQQAPAQVLSDSTLNFNVNNGKIETALLNNTQQQHSKNSKKLHSGHVGPILNTNINSLFKPVLNFIGIDVPSGTIVDNLFKEFGSCLIGNLNIKSVDINILGTTKKFNENLFHNEHNQFIKFRKANTPVGGTKATNLQSSVTTILSFDSLLLNINVRQVLPADSVEQQAQQEPQQEPLNATKRKSTIRTTHSLNAGRGVRIRLPKYYTKIDTSIKLNNLTQEVNMPLLRLAHQLYSIIADTIEYDKEQYDQTTTQAESINNSYNELARKVDSKMKHYDMDYEYNSDDDDDDDDEEKKDAQLKPPPPQRKHQYQPSNQSISKDCWTYMDSVVQLRDFIPEPKFIEKISEIDKDTLRQKQPKQRIYHITKNVPESESNLVSLFGWININQINSRAGIGTLTYSGQMKNVQLSVMFGKKFQGILNSKKHYEGSLNLRMDSTSGKLTENDENVVVQMNVGKSHTFCYLKKLNLKHLISSFVHIGKINIDVPLRPMDVHSVVYRESKVIEQKILPEFKDFVMFDSIGPQGGSGQQQTGGQGLGDSMASGVPGSSTGIPDFRNAFDDTSSQATTLNEMKQFRTNNTHMKRNKSNASLRNANTQQQQQQQQAQPQLNRFYFNLKSKFDGCDIRAKLLEKPCLKAAYIMNNIEFIASLNGGKSKLTCILYEHRLSFESDNLSATTPGSNPSTTSSSSTASSNAFLSHSLSHTTSFKQHQQQQQQNSENNNTTLTNFDLPGIEVNGIYNSRLNIVEVDTSQQHHHKNRHHRTTQHQPPASIKQQIIDIQLNVKVSELTRELNADVIAQLVFVTKIFIKEINYILQAIYNLDNFNYKTTSQQQIPQKVVVPPPPPPPQQMVNETPAAKIFYDVHIDIGKIVLTAITPTFTSLSICTGDKNMAKLTNTFLNANKYLSNEYTLKPSVEAKCNISVDLKTCFAKQNEFNKKQQQSEDGKQSENGSDKQQQQQQQDSGQESSTSEDDWYKLASFDTKIDLKNAIRILSKEHDREAIIITVENPRFYLQTGAVDNAILFWLNYKSTYESWLNKRQQFAALFNADNDLSAPLSAAAASTSKRATSSSYNANNSNNNNFLALKIRVTGLGLALLLSNKLSKDFRTKSDCLVITLNDTSIYACSSGCVVSKGQFSNFCLRFAENFNLASADWMPIVTPFVINKTESIYLNTLLNAWLVPSGSYEVCSSTIEANQTTKLNRPIWILNVKWKMEGIDVNLDTTIGKWLSKFSSTVTRLAETQSSYEDSNHDQSRDHELRKLKNELQYYKDCGDTVNANLTQLKIDRLSVASYPEKAKKILAKTRNNLKGQFGFNTNQTSPTFPPNSPPTNQTTTTTTTTGADSGPTTRRQASIKITKEETKLLNQTAANGQQHSRSKSGDINIRRGHTRTKSEPFSRIFTLIKSLSNDDSSLESINESKSALYSCPATPTSQKTTPEHSYKLNANHHPSTIEENNEAESSFNLNKSVPKLLPPVTLGTSGGVVDFKLDVQIEISSGKCVLHAAKPPAPPQQQQLHPQVAQQQKSTASGSVRSQVPAHAGGGSTLNQHQQGFYNPTYRYSHLGGDDQSSGSVLYDDGNYQSQTRLTIINEQQQYYQRYQQYQQQNSNKITNFIFPAIRIKAEYESTYVEINKRPFKKANLYSSIRIESFVLPQTYMLQSDYFKTKDMCIGPQLLDFLENTLEPFSLASKAHQKAHEAHDDLKQVNVDEEEEVSDEDIFDDTFSSHYNQQQYQRQQQQQQQHRQHYQSSNENGGGTLNNSIVLSNAKPASQTQVYFPVDVIVVISMMPSSVRFTCAPQSTMDCLLRLPTIELVFSTKSLSNQLLQNNENETEKHPTIISSIRNSIFGKPSPTKSTSTKPIENGNDNGGGLSVSCCMTDFSLKFYNRLGKQGPSESRYLYSETRHQLEDKDSLSVRVEFIKVNISRSRRLLNQFNNSDKFNDVKLSVLADIGRASFIYDMRNIKEVFVFPKIWYRRSLARRLFLGEEPTVTSSNLNSNRNSQSPPPPAPAASNHFAAQSSPQDDLAQKQMKRNKRQQQPPAQHHETHFLHSNGSSNWQTLVLVSINLSELEVKMNVGDVLGHVAWLTRNARSISRISISSFGPRKMQFNFILDNSRLIADGGQTRCMIRVQDISSFVEMNDEETKPHIVNNESLSNAPDTLNKIDLNVFAMEFRVDNHYDHSSPILTCRLSNLNARLNDLWKTVQENEVKANNIFLELHVSWDQFHLMITRSTTPDLILFYYKLADYVKKQFTESKDYIKECDLDLFYEMKLKQQFMEQKEILLKKRFHVPGGGIYIKGNNFTIITFHGVNFKASKWALFSLNEPSWDLSTDKSLKLNEGNSQNLYFDLGRSEKYDKMNQNMASIYMVYRESMSVSSYQSINEWFEYAHQGIDAVGLRDFPRFTIDNDQNMTEIIKKTKISEQIKSEEIFHLPRLQVYYNSTIVKDKVSFVFRTEFHDHILTTFSTQHMHFLYELIKGYIKQKEDNIKNKEEYIPPSKLDERVYECIFWKLEPTLKFISKVGSVDSFGVDTLLKNLGLNHSKTTIPKWTQRGIMDNANELIEKIIKAYMKILPERP